MTNHWKLLWTGWGLFVASLFLPAVKVDWGAWDSPDAPYALGLGCAIVFPYFYPSNALMLLAPALFKCCGLRRFCGWPRITLATVLLLSLVGAASCSLMCRAIHMGFVFWVASFLVVAAAFLKIPAHHGTDHRKPAAGAPPGPDL